MTRDGKISGGAKAGWLPDGLLVAVALVLWAVFFPGLMSTDSIVQYRQAVTGVYSDWHPPLMSLVLHAVLALGGSLGLLMLAQCLAGVLGVRALVRSAVALLYDRGDREVERRAAWLPLVVLLLLLIPVTPLAFYLMTFWKDVWAMILMLWICALGLDFVRCGPGPVRLLLLILLGAALGQVRHNALVVLPILGLVIWEGTRQSLGWGRWRRLALAAAPLALHLVAWPLIDRIFDVEKLHPDSQIMALDLVGICAADRAACARLPWTSAHVLDWSSLDHYRPGDFGFIFWDKPPHVDPSIRLDYPRLRTEYLRAIREFPGTFVRVKLEAFETLLGMRETEYFFHRTIVENPFGLALNERFAPVREELASLADRVAAGGALRWILGVAVAERHPEDLPEHDSGEEGGDRHRHREHGAQSPEPPAQKDQNPGRAEERQQVVAREQDAEGEPDPQGLTPTRERLDLPEKRQAEEAQGDDGGVGVGETGPVHPPRIGGEERQETGRRLLSQPATQGQPEDGERAHGQEDVGDQPPGSIPQQFHERVGEQRIEDAPQGDAELPLIAGSAVEHQERRLEMEVIDVQGVVARLPEERLLQSGGVGRERPGVDPDPQREEEAGTEEQAPVPRRAVHAPASRSSTT